VEGSLGTSRSALLSRRDKGQVVQLKLPERWTNITNLRIEVPSDACMYKYSFSSVGIRDKTNSKTKYVPPEIASKSEMRCQNGKYLETVVFETTSVASKRGSRNKSSPQSVFSFRSPRSSMDQSSYSGSSRRSSGLSSEDKGGSKRELKYAPKKAPPTTMSRLNMFLQSCIMSPNVLYDSLDLMSYE